MPEGRRPRGVTRRLTSGREAESARLRRHRNGREELPLFGGQEPAARRSPATEVRGGDERSYPASEVRVWEERSYLASEVRGCGRFVFPHVRGQVGRPRGVTPRPRSGPDAGRSYPRPPSQRPGAAPGRSNHTSKEPRLCGHRRA